MSNLGAKKCRRFERKCCKTWGEEQSDKDEKETKVQTTKLRHFYV